MKNIMISAPQYDVNDTVAFLDDASKVIRGKVKLISQTLEDIPKVYYKVKTVAGEQVVEERNLLFAELEFLKPLFSVGMCVSTSQGVVGTITEIDMTWDGTSYTIQYELDTEEVVDEDEIEAVAYAQ